MKRDVLLVSIICLCFCIFPMAAKADCSSSEKLQINTQASYVTYSVAFNSDGTFDVTFENLTSSLAIEYNKKIYPATKKGVTIKNLKEGTVLRANVVASDNTNCPEDIARHMTYRVPYYNHYLDSEECSLYPEVEVCKTKFFSYEMTKSLFQSMFDKQKGQLVEEEPPVVVDEPTWKDILFDYLYKYGMQVFLFTIGTLCTFILGHNALKRAKSKF